MQFAYKNHLIAALGALAIGLAGPVSAADDGDYEPSVGQEGKDVVWVPTGDSLVARMLDMADLKAGDRLVDLGSGDGRTVIAAARRGIPARGIEYNPELVQLSIRNAQRAGVSDLAKFEEADIFESDFSEATVVTLFLLPQLNLRLRPLLLDMPPGTRVISNSFDMEDWEPDERTEVTEKDCASWCRAYKWVVPAKVGGTWKLDGGELELTQTFQMLEGTLQRGGQAIAIREARMDGAQIRFSAGGQHYVGTVDGNTMHGTIDGGQAWRATR